jgi:signal peptide peptidase SppA
VYDRILAEVAARPWAIEKRLGCVIADVLNRRISGGREPLNDTWAELRAGIQARRKAAAGRPPGGVALVAVYGVLTQRADMFTEISGMTSTESVGRAIDEAGADPGVETIVMDVDSPGGSVFGVGELAAKVAAAARAKKVIAVANSLAASAAYWVAAQASELVVTPGGQVGSVGIYQMHVDRSEEMKAAGRAVTFVSAGERKTAGNEYAPLDSAGRAEMEEIVNGYYEQFVRAVATGRKTSLSAVRTGFGKGGMVLAAPAVSEGMADKVGTLDEVLGRYGVSLGDVAPAAARKSSAVEVRRRRMTFGGPGT